MDSKDRSESRFDPREEPLARRIGQALNDLDSRNASDCPDGEILAAYAERGLAQEETARWEGHFATCARCRKILLVLHGSVGSPLAEREVARLLEHDENARSGAKPSRPASPRAWPHLTDWRLRWLAPALGVAAAVAVLLVMRPPHRSGNRAGQETLIAQAPTQQVAPSPAAPEVNGLSRVAPQEAQKSPALPHTNRSFAPGAAPLNSPAGGLPKSRAGTNAASNVLSPSADVLAGSASADKKLSPAPKAIEGRPGSPLISAANAAAPQAAAVPAPAAPQLQAQALEKAAPGGDTQLDAQANAPKEEGSREKQVVSAQGEAAPKAVAGAAPQQLTAELRSAGRGAQAFTLARPLQKDAGVLKAPSGSTFWRVGLGGNIERSPDAGTTWVSQASPSQEGWLAGAAVSDKVCWLVGRHGSIARTVDGEHWQLVAPPPAAAEQRANFADFTSIAATDAQTATITSADGRKFLTTDGGKTWQLP